MMGKVMATDNMFSIRSIIKALYFGVMHLEIKVYHPITPNIVNRKKTEQPSQAISKGKSLFILIDLLTAFECTEHCQRIRGDNSLVSYIVIYPLIAYECTEHGQRKRDDNATYTEKQEAKKTTQ